jgi:phosphatidylserine/phosphatidylglycerophosphate/cardiolipin synthase-like enzyme
MRKAFLSFVFIIIPDVLYFLPSEQLSEALKRAAVRGRVLRAGVNRGAAPIFDFFGYFLFKQKKVTG